MRIENYPNIHLITNIWGILITIPMSMVCKKSLLGEKIWMGLPQSGTMSLYHPQISHFQVTNPSQHCMCFCGRLSLWMRQTPYKDQQEIIKHVLTSRKLVCYHKIVRNIPWIIMTQRTIPIWNIPHKYLIL